MVKKPKPVLMHNSQTFCWEILTIALVPKMSIAIVKSLLFDELYLLPIPEAKKCVSCGCKNLWLLDVAKEYSDLTNTTLFHKFSASISYIRKSMRW